MMDRTVRLRDALLLEAISVVVTIVLIFTVAGLAGQGQKDLAERVDKNTASTVANTEELKEQTFLIKEAQDQNDAQLKAINKLERKSDQQFAEHRLANERAHAILICLEAGGALEACTIEAQKIKRVPHEGGSPRL